MTAVGRLQLRSLDVSRYARPKRSDISGRLDSTSPSWSGRTGGANNRSDWATRAALAPVQGRQTVCTLVNSWMPKLANSLPNPLRRTPPKGILASE